ncbi:AzlC family ABC transporter permease [Lactococcus nasutitermitis]|uniref:AzlC family ABC transporter permease n=1 Tax=Lactococcus nasutitermitis TaxID=1652957 RepID=A0ABV9JEC0_9LACT|nr:AzlC family ABC transporter permease [Lactococcus nasutitermitis]
MNDILSFRQGVRDTLPTVFGYIGIGLAFGIVGHAAGVNVLVIFLLSTIVYAGSAQFIAVSMLAVSSPILSIVLSVFLVNSRMILMSMTVASYFKEESILKNIWIGTLLTDESFALGMSKRNTTGNKLSVSWYSASNVMAYIAWGISSVLGALLGGLIPNSTKFGLGFAITAMFIGLLYLQINADKSLSQRLQLIMVLVTLGLVFVGMIFIPSSILVLVVTLIACGLGVWLKRAYF